MIAWQWVVGALFVGWTFGVVAMAFIAGAKCCSCQVGGHY